MHITPSLLYQDTQEIKRISVTIPCSFYFQSGVRDFTLDIVRNLTSLPDQWAFRFQTIVDELCNNAIEHGSKGEGELCLTLYVLPTQWLEVVVEDMGYAKGVKAQRLTEIVEEKKRLADAQVQGLRGRGLGRIVAKWTDELSFHDRPTGGMMVKARKYIPS